MTEKKLEYNIIPLYTFSGVINRVVDADTVEATLDMGFRIFTTQRLRIDSFDAPETWRPRNDAEEKHGIAATVRAKELLVGKDLLFTTSKRSGIYGRFGASITLPDGRNFAKTMIEEGFQKRDEYVVEETS